MHAILIPWGLFYSCCFICSALSQIAQNCPPGEIKVECIDRCQTCEYRNGRCSQGQVCTPGCNCLNGYFRNQRGECVAAAFCDASPLTPPDTIPVNAARSNCELVTVGNGSFNYSDIPGGRQFDITCDKKYQGRFTCYYDRGFTTPLPYCVKPKPSPLNPPDTIPVNAARSDCELVTVGAYNCTEFPGGRQCDITCVGKYQGRFTCYYQSGWTSPLPKCVKPKPSSLTPPDTVPVNPARSDCELVTVGNGNYICSQIPGGKQCDIICDGNNQGRFTCYYQTGWTRPLPYCVKPKQSSLTPPDSTARSDCELVTVGNGIYNCFQIPGGTQCDIICDGNNQGRFTCYYQSGWTRPLPYCVKPKPSSLTPPDTIPVNPARSDCELVTVGNGSYSCSQIPGGKQCDIICDGNNQGRFTCYYQSGWTRPLPYCVKPKPTCGPNSTPSDCASYCPRTCNSDRELKACPAVCIDGCICNQGFIDDGNGNCIPENACPGGVCGYNEELLECGSACPPTCDDRKPGICTLQCVHGCFCKKDFIRERKGGRCIPESQCPSNVCGPNSTPSDCVYCEPTCRNPKPEACAQGCAKGCACYPGFLKDDNGNCILQYQCPRPAPA